jgi:hypothetical protein
MLVPLALPRIQRINGLIAIDLAWRLGVVSKTYEIGML